MYQPGNQRHTAKNQAYQHSVKREGKNLLAAWVAPYGTLKPILLLSPTAILIRQIDREVSHDYHDRHDLLTKLNDLPLEMRLWHLL